MRTLVALAVLVLAACDPCSAATAIHRDRCMNGDATSCAWLDEHATAAGTCH